MSGRRATLASMGFNADVGSDTAHTEAMGTRLKSVGSRCSLTCRQRSPRKREDDLLPDMEQQGGSRDVSPLNAQDAIPHCPATKKKPPQFDSHALVALKGRNYDGSAYDFSCKPRAETSSLGFCRGAAEKQLVEKTSTFCGYICI